MGSEVKIQIPEQVISNIIHAEIAEQLSNKPALIESAVRVMLETKEDRYSSSPTLFVKLVREMITAEAKTLLGEWIEKNREKIRAALLKNLDGQNQKRIKEVCDSVVSGMSKYTATVHLHIKD